MSAYGQHEICTRGCICYRCENRGEKRAHCMDCDGEPDITKHEAFTNGYLLECLSFQPMEEQDPARRAADLFALFTSGLSLEQMAQTVEYIAADLTQARQDAQEIAEEMRAIRKLLESEG